MSLMVDPNGDFVAIARRHVQTAERQVVLAQEALDEARRTLDTVVAYKASYEASSPTSALASAQSTPRAKEDV